MPLPWQTGKVIRIEDETQTTRRFWIEWVSGQPFDFKPGQFVTLDLPIDEKPGKRWRSYSIASWPDGTPVFELLIVYMESGKGTNYLFNEICVGSELIFRGPLGFFTLPDPIEKELFLICTGTGIAPFRSMVHHILNHNIAHQNIHLIFGCRRLTDSLYQKEMEELQEQVPRFQYIPVFSREVPENQQHLIRTGYVHSVYEEICKKNFSPEGSGQPLAAGNDIFSEGSGQPLSAINDIPSPDSITSGYGSGKPLSIVSPAHFYLCGWKNMIDEAKQRILAMGYDKKSVHLELYG